MIGITIFKRVPLIERIYNTVVDLSWTACYVSAEYFIYLDGKPVEIEGISSIETAYTALRKAEGLVQHPGADGSPFTYLKKCVHNLTQSSTL